MCKFDDKNAPGFGLVVEGITRYAEEAPARIKRNWDAENKERSTVKQAGAAELFSASVKNTPQSDSASTFEGESSLGREQRALPSAESQANFDDKYILEDVSNDRKMA